MYQSFGLVVIFMRFGKPKLAPTKGTAVTIGTNELTKSLKLPPLWENRILGCLDSVRDDKLTIKHLEELTHPPSVRAS